MALKPVMFISLRTFLMQSTQGLMFAKDFLPAAWPFLVTILPFLFFIRSPFFRPVDVFSLRPAKTTALMKAPLAIFETFMAFITFIDFMVFFMVFIGFGRAMLTSKGRRYWKNNKCKSKRAVLVS